MNEDDGYDGVQYDTFYAPSPGQLEAEAIRRECAEQAASHAHGKADTVIVVSAQSGRRSA